MTTKEIEQGVKNCIENIIEQPHVITFDQKVEILGDSLDQIMFQMELETQFGIDLGLEEIESCDTFNDVINLVQNKLL